MHPRIPWTARQQRIDCCTWCSHERASRSCSLCKYVSLERKTALPRPTGSPPRQNKHDSVTRPPSRAETKRPSSQSVMIHTAERNPIAATPLGRSQGNSSSENRRQMHRPISTVELLSLGLEGHLPFRTTWSDLSWSTSSGIETHKTTTVVHHCGGTVLQLDASRENISLRQ